MSFSLWIQFNISLITWKGLQTQTTFQPCRIFCSAEKPLKRLWRQELTSDTRPRGWLCCIFKKFFINSQKFQCSIFICWCWRTENSQTEMVHMFWFCQQHLLHCLDLRIWSSSDGGQKNKPGSGVQECLWYNHQQQNIWEDCSDSVSEQSWSVGKKSIKRQYSSLFPRIWVS